MKLKIDEEWRVPLFNSGLVLLIALVGFAKHDFRPYEPPLIGQIVTELVAPIQKGVNTVKKSFTDFSDHYLNIVATRKENEFLRTQVEDLNQELFKLSSLAKENERLKALLAFGEQISFVKVLGQVIGWDATSEYKLLRIDKGSREGIKTRSAVITANGLVGYTYRVFPHYTDILTILDSNNRVDVLVDRTRSHGIVEGISQMSCRMKYVPRTEKLEIGDLLVTAGLGLLYPKGIKVGVIEGIDEAAKGLTQEVKVTPSVDFTKLEEVVVLIRQ